MTYSLLTDEMRLELLRERVLELEAQHFRGVLLRMEAEHLGNRDELPGIDRKLDELARRIDRHTAAAQPAASAAGEQQATSDPDEPTVESEPSAAQRNGRAALAAP